MKDSPYPKRPSTQPISLLLFLPSVLHLRHLFPRQSTSLFPFIAMPSRRQACSPFPLASHPLAQDTLEDSSRNPVIKARLQELSAQQERRRKKKAYRTQDGCPPGYQVAPRGCRRIRPSPSARRTKNDLKPWIMNRNEHARFHRLRVAIPPCRLPLSRVLPCKWEELKWLLWPLMSRRRACQEAQSETRKTSQKQLTWISSRPRSYQRIHPSPSVRCRLEERPNGSQGRGQ